MGVYVGGGDVGDGMEVEGLITLLSIVNVLPFFSTVLGRSVADFDAPNAPGGNDELRAEEGMGGRGEVGGGPGIGEGGGPREVLRRVLVRTI